MPLLLFHDLHVGMALAAAGDWSGATLQLDRLRQRGHDAGKVSPRMGPSGLRGGGRRRHGAVCELFHARRGHGAVEVSRRGLGAEVRGLEVSGAAAIVTP